MRFVLTLALIALAGALAAECAQCASGVKPAECADCGPATSTGEVAAADLAPDFTLPDQDGNDVTLSSLRGNVVVLEWFNVECPYVKRHLEAGTMNRLATKYADQSVVWLGIDSSRHHGVAEVKQAHSAENLAYRILSDQSGDVGRAYQARTTPHMIIIDAAGRVVYDGAIDDDPRGKQAEDVNYVEQALDQILAGEAVSVMKTKPYGCSVKYAKKAKGKAKKDA